MANEDKASHYHRLQRRASFASTTAGVAFLVFLVGSGAARALLNAIESAAGPSRLAVTTLFVAALIAAHELLVLPLTYYRGVTLERRYGHLLSQAVAAADETGAEEIVLAEPKGLFQSGAADVVTVTRPQLERRRLALVA